MASSDIQPHDSASQVGGGSALSAKSQSSVRVRIAGLRARADALRRMQQLELQEQKVKHQKAQLELDTEVAVAEAEMQELQSLNDEEPDNEVQFRTDKAEHRVSTLNPEAPEWPQEQTDVVNGVGVLSQQQLLATIHLPQARIMTFDGNPLEYWTFIRSFENSIESVCTDDNSKLIRLLQYCTGKAKQVIHCCAVMDPKEGYKRARNLLKERFGNNYSIAEAWISKVTDGRCIRPHDGEALRDFADELRSCQATLKAMNCLNEVNTQRVLVKIVARLPYYLQMRWIREVRDVKAKRNKPAEFDDLVSFVDASAEEVTDPVYSKLFTAAKDRHYDAHVKGESKAQKSQHFPRSTVAHSAVSADRSSCHQVCVMCDGSHKIYQCAKFKESSPEARIRFVRDKGLCFNCLNVGHRASVCTSDRKCSVTGCGKRHSYLLHKPHSDTRVSISADDSRRNEQNALAVENATVSVDAEERCLVTGAGTIKTALPLVPVKVWSPDGTRSVLTYALLDSGSTTSFCTESLARTLGIQGERESLALSTLMSSVDSLEMSVLELNISDVHEQHMVHLDRIYAMRNLPVTVQNAAIQEDVDKWPHLRDIDLVDSSSVSKVDLLIGQDVPTVLAPLEVRKAGAKAPFAVRTLLGWTVQGPLGKTQHTSAIVNFVTDDTLQQSLERFWKLDDHQNLNGDIKDMSVQDRQAVAVMESTIKYVDGRYEIAIPFKGEQVNMPDNRIAAELRLQGLSRRFSRDTMLRDRYSANMEDLFSKKYASKVPDEQLMRSDGKVWYLPHHAVLNPKKPEKVRIVFDCAAKFNDVSLNEQVLSGPDLTNRLIGILLRFRQEPVAIMADIESMFHQVRVNPDDRDVLRFLWWPHGDVSQEPAVYRMNVHLFGGTWCPSCCSFALRRVATDNQQDFMTETVNTVMRNFYVDDCLKSVKDETEAILLIQELRSLLNRGGFRLTKFMSNSERVLESVPPKERSEGVKHIDFELDYERALGISWSVSEDCFVFNTHCKSVPSTKRGLLSSMSSVYDPLGFLSPFVLKAKILVQDLTRRKAGWDESLLEKEQRDWTQWLEGHERLKELRIPRCLKLASAQDAQYELHHFADASSIAYGCVSYLRIFEQDEKAHCGFLTAKSRLAPIRAVSIPRLELMAAVLAVNVDQMLKRELDLCIQRTVFWTDSTVVLQYIHSESKRFHTFVANRVSMIREATLPEQWRHVPTKQNPADNASRGLTAEELLANERWWSGPSFLQYPEDTWPMLRYWSVVSDDDPEVKINASAVHVLNVTDLKQIDVVDQLFRYRASWVKLKVDVAWILRFMSYLEGKSNPEVPVRRGRLEVSELQKAELQIVKYVQCKEFEIDVAKLNVEDVRKPVVVSKSSRLYRLEPIMGEDGIVRVGGRLSTHQIILPNVHPVTNLVINHFHVMSGHGGKEHTLSLIRQQYWIISARQAVRKQLRECVVCRLRDAKPVSQRMADLPFDRITPGDPPFSYVGVDVFGPFSVKRGRSIVKRYGCLFTCLKIRAIHIEVIHSLDTDSFINALQRFICRRGQVKEIRSDNGTNFVGAEKELRTAILKWNSNKIDNFLRQKTIQWRFNPPAASHMGGVWERLIRSVRKVLSSVMKEQSLDDEALTTMFCLAESVINSRPITVVSDDHRDLEPLTPNHLLLLREDPVLPPGEFVRQDIYARRRWRQVQYLADVFWRRWTREYLPLIQLRQKWLQSSKNIAVGDVVILMDDNAPRNTWDIGRVIETYPSSDGLVRTVRVATKSGDRTRPVHKLCPIEPSSDA